MKTYQASEIRNFALVGHASSGKTMLSEAMLACAGVISRMGSIANGTTVSDYHENECERKISIQLSLMHLDWGGKKFNIMDCPGYLDFIGEALSGLRAADCAVIVVDAKDGVGVGTHQVWEYATQFGIPKIFVINGLDKDGADFDRALGQIRQSFGERAFPLTLPVNPGPGFDQVLDTLRSSVLKYASDRSGKAEETPAGGELAERVKTLHQQLIEYIAESDDALLEKFFDKGTLTEEELRGGLHRAFLQQTFMPVFATCAEKNVGVSRLMDFIGKYGVSPADRGKTKAVDANGAEVELDITNPEPVLFVFKTMNEPKFGELSFFRVYSGKLDLGMELYNTDTRVTEKISQIYILNGQNRVLVDHLPAGDIGATVKLKNTHTGNTLCSPKLNLTLPKVQFPKPNIHAALELKVKGEEDKLSQGLAALHQVDPTFMWTVDAELRQTIVSAQGEMHLAVITDELKKRYRVEVELVPPKIRFRETIKARAEAKYRHKKQTGGAGQFAEVWMRIEPKPRDTGLEFTESLVGQNVDRVFVPSVEKGVNRAAAEGILAGYRVTDVKVDFYDGKMHPVDSNDISFQIAGYYAFREAFMNAKPCLLEPIHTLEIKVPDEFVGAVMGDLSGRRGKILGIDSVGGMQIIRAQVPAAELYRYATTLRSLTGGRGVHTEEFSHYEEMPAHLQQKVIEESKKAREQQRQEK
ncbi:MAG: elongation factor G [Verrucomicrobiae bacterium]|nr:elongation factor G [Verrucomicrobiae bacterium]MCX7722269.1 elongation factor G [Verrucomicrobiae bacterium]MDW7981099.1 elongation factor G [Verrucomicrobiales bacterium]